MKPPVWFAMALVALSAVACAHRPGPQAERAAPSRLAGAHSIFLGDLGPTTDAAEARTLLWKELERRGQFVIAESADQADAVMRGNIVVRRARSGRLEGARAYGDVALFQTGTRRLLWRHVYDERSVEPITNATTPRELLQRVVAQLCDQLERDAQASAARPPTRITLDGRRTP